MLLPTIYTSAFVAVFSWANFFPSGFQLPVINWQAETHIISPLPTHTSTPTPTMKRLTPTPTKTLTPPPTYRFVPTATPKPTAKPTIQPTLKPTLQPTVKPTATPSSIPTVKPTAIPTPTTSNLLDSTQQYLLDQINQYRADNGLSAVKADKNTCDFAKVRSEEIVSSFTHDGFTNRSNAHTLPYPTYHNVTENIAMTSDYKQVVTMWKNSAGHAANMRSDTPYVCVAYTGNYYAYEGWKP
jgi:uncharacterized protein YkwD